MLGITSALVLPRILQLQLNILEGRADSRQAVLVGVANLLEYRRRSLRHGGLAALHGKEAQLVLHNVCHGLRVGGRARPAAPDGVVDPRQLVRHAIRNVGPRRRPRIGACVSKPSVPREEESRWVPKGRGIPRMTPSLKVTAMMEVPRLDKVSALRRGQSARHLLDLALLQAIHVDVDAI